MSTARSRQHDLLVVGGWDHNPSAGFLKSEPTLHFPSINADNVSELSFPQTFSTAPAPAQQRRKLGIGSRLYIVLVAGVSFALLLSQIATNGLRRGLWTSADLAIAALPNTSAHITTASLVLWVCSGVLVGVTLATLLIRWGAFQRNCGYLFIALTVQAIPWLYLVVYHQ